MITVDATQVAEGVDYASFLADYYDGLPVGASTYHGGEPSFAYGGSYYVSGPQVAFSFEEFAQMVLLSGSDIAYDFIANGAQYGHGISGDIDSITFGYDSDSVTTADGTENGLLVGLEGLTISGLGLEAEPGSGNVLENPVYALYTAARTGTNGEEVDFIDWMYDLFSTEAQHILGSEADDVFTATEFDDIVEGNGGNDLLDGGEGDDRIHGGEGADTITGGEGDDFVSGDAGDDLISGDVGSDTLYGRDGDDTIDGGDGDDLVAGFDGDDLLDGGAGNDTIMAGEGSDTVDGGAGDDRIFGRDGDDVLNGGEGDDRIFGDAGNDTITGGAGRDGLFGGEGEDVFVYESATDSEFGAADNIRDFEVGTDTIDLSAFGELAFVERFSETEGEIRMVEREDAGRTAVQVDVDGDGSADLYIVVHATGLTESDFLV